MLFNSFPLHVPAARTLAALGLATLLAACGSSGSIPLKNPNYFSGRVDKDTGVMTGLYNPAGYSQSQVKDLVAQICTGKRLASYSDAASSDLRSFTLTCRGGFDRKWGFVSFERTARGTVMIVSTGSDGRGTMVFTQSEVPMGPRGASATPLPAAPATAQSATARPAAAQTAPATGAAPTRAAPACRHSITIYCKESGSGRIIPNVKPGQS